jgi:hypothetical protein
MEYDVDAQIGGKLAMLGSRLIKSTARSLAEQFFTKFAALMKQAPSSGSTAKTKPAKKTKATPARKNWQQRNLRSRGQPQPRQKRRRSSLNHAETLAHKNVLVHYLSKNQSVHSDLTKDEFVKCCHVCAASHWQVSFVADIVMRPTNCSSIFVLTRLDRLMSVFT